MSQCHAFENMAASIVVGGKFASFDELQNCVRQFEQEKFVCLYIRSLQN